MTLCYCQYFRQYNILTLKDSVSVFFLTSLIRAAKLVHSFKESLLARMYSRFNRQFKIQPTFNWPVQRFYRQAKKWNSSMIQRTFIWPVQRFYRQAKKWEIKHGGSHRNLSWTKHWWKTPTRSLMNGPHVTLSVHAVNNVSTFKDTRQTILSITQLFI